MQLLAGIGAVVGVDAVVEQQNRNMLKWTLIVIAAMQMPHIAILPGTNLIATEVFSEYPIQTIQTAMSSPGVFSVISSLLSGMLMRYGIATKKSMTVLGLAFIAIAGVAALFLHSHFWQLWLLNCLIGTGTGIFVPSSQSLMFDSFDENTRHFMTGIQFSFINGGGLVLSYLCGLLIAVKWYGGHALMLVAIPFAVAAYIVIPKGVREKPVKSGGAAKTKIPPRVYYYAFIVFIYIIMYSAAALNVSTHIEQGAMGDPSMAGIATALLMGGATVSGYIIPKISKGLHDHIFSVAFILLAVAFGLMSLFPESLAITLSAMFIVGISMSMIVPRCIFQASNLSDPTNSSTITVLVCSVAASVGNICSPLIITNLTLAIGGESTRFRFLFTMFVCLALTVLIFIYNYYMDKRVKINE